MPWGRWCAGAANRAGRGGPSFSFDEEGRAKIAADAIRLAAAHARGASSRAIGPTIEKGAREAVPPSAEEAAKRLADDADAVVAMVNGPQVPQGPSPGPWDGSPGPWARSTILVARPAGSRDASDAPRFSAYFPRERWSGSLSVFNGYGAFDLASGGLPRFRFDHPGALHGRPRSLAARLSSAGTAAPSAAIDFDDRSVPFAIASLCYSQPSPIPAQVWYRVWQR
jgi:hypothetical protein